MSTSPSKAELAERVKRKIEDGSRVLWPVVSEKIESLREAKREGARRVGDKEYRTVFDMDLCHAINVGAVTDCCPVENPESGWSLTFVGSDTEGDELTVLVHLTKSESEPLQITDFVISSGLKK
jgi:hypothetical protein